MHKKRVGVLRGGPSSEHEVSIKTGGSVLKHLPEEYNAIDIYIDREGVWHMHGIPFDPKDLHSKVDVVFNALHGEFGEDGKVQKILETFKIPFTGSGSLASALGMSKPLAKKLFIQHGLKTPYAIVLKKEDYNEEVARHIFHTFPMPAVIKPTIGGSSVATFIAKTLVELKESLDKAFEQTEEVIIEEYIKGKEATAGVLENFRGQKIYPLLPIEIIPPPSAGFFSLDVKYNGETQELCPGNFTKEESEALQKMAIIAHKAIGAKHYSRSDFIIHPKRGIYILEINTLPGLTDQSLIPKSVSAVGSSFKELLKHLVELALENKK